MLSHLAHQQPAQTKLAAAKREQTDRIWLLRMIVSGISRLCCRKLTQDVMSCMTPHYTLVGCHLSSHMLIILCAVCRSISCHLSLLVHVWLLQPRICKHTRAVANDSLNSVNRAAFYSQSVMPRKATGTTNIVRLEQKLDVATVT